jgi:hypothetical protein
MTINSLEQMESIVKDNDSLQWDGWDVLELKPTPTAWMKPEGAFINNTWSLVKRFSPSESGWDIPNKFVRNNAG